MDLMVMIVFAIIRALGYSIFGFGIIKSIKGKDQNNDLSGDHMIVLGAILLIASEICFLT